MPKSSSDNRFIDCPVRFQANRLKNFIVTDWHREMASRFPDFSSDSCLFSDRQLASRLQRFV